METLTVSLTKDVQDKEKIIAELRATVTEKDLEIAKTIMQIDKTATEYQSKVDEERNQIKALNSEVEDLREKNGLLEQESRQLV